MPKLPGVGTNLKRLRKEHGDIGQKELANATKVSFRTIQNSEAGHTDMGAGNLIALSRHFNITVEELAGEKRDQQGVRGNEEKMLPRPLPEDPFKEVQRFLNRVASLSIGQRKELENALEIIESGLDLGLGNYFEKDSNKGPHQG